MTFLLYDKGVKLIETDSNQIQFFSWFVLVFCLLLGWLGITLSLLGIFFGVIIKIYLAVALIFLAFLASKKIKSDFWKSELFLVVIISLIFVAVFLSFSSPTVFSGRDQGSLSEAAIRLAENNTLVSSSLISEEFFKIYGPGKALNFPGFNYNFEGKLITQFSLGYISWLASFFSVFGLSGFAVANGLTFFIFLVSFYLVVRRFLPFGSALAALFLVATAFVFPWFLKFTLSENLAWALFWFGIFQLLNFWQKACLPVGMEDRNSFIYLILTWGLLVFSRLEAWTFILVIGMLLFFKLRKKADLQILVWEKKNLMLILAVAVVFTGSVLINPQAYFELFRGVAKPLIFFQQEVSNINAFSLFFYILKVLNIYFLLSFLILAAVGIGKFLWQRKIEMLIPFFVALPTFFYLIQPGITLDHPWMLRRLAFSVIPLLILYTVFFLHDFFKKRLFFYLIAGLLLAGNVWVSAHFLTFIPDKNLLSQTADLSQNFATEDLVFVDREASLSGWSMMTGPLSFIFEKQAVYLFNPKDVAKINLDKFQDVYFIIPEGRLSFYEKNGLQGRLIYVKDYQLQNKVLEESLVDKNQVDSKEVVLPKIKNVTINGGIYNLEK